MRLGRLAAIDAALHLERPFLGVAVTPEGLAQVAALATDLRLPVAGTELSEGRHPFTLRAHRRVVEGDISGYYGVCTRVHVLP